MTDEVTAFENRITRELSTYGDVMIMGHATPVFGKMLVDNLGALISSPNWMSPLKVTIQVGEDGTTPLYLNRDGERIFPPSNNAFDTSAAHSRKRWEHLFDAANRDFTERYVAIRLRERELEKSALIGRKRAKNRFVGSLFISALAVAFVTFFFLDFDFLSAVITGLVVGPPLYVMAVELNSDRTRPSLRMFDTPSTAFAVENHPLSLSEEDSDLEGCDEVVPDSKELFYRVFESDAERSAFLQELSLACNRHGVKWDASTLNFKRGAGQRKSMVAFEANVLPLAVRDDRLSIEEQTNCETLQTQYGLKTVVLFDGVSLFRYQGGPILIG